MGIYLGLAYRAMLTAKNNYGSRVFVATVVFFEKRLFLKGTFVQNFIIYT